MFDDLMREVEIKVNSLAKTFYHSIEGKVTNVINRILVAASAMVVFCFTLNSLIFQIGTQYEEVGFFVWQKVNTFYFIISLLALGISRVAIKGLKEDKRIHPHNLDPEIPIRRISQQRKIYDRPTKKRSTKRTASTEGSR